uniref:TLC domain-containing protein n=1 Tax=Angiostrongylus cantonensis TaxID=6313 RepID=A0A0K0CY35_ANGCA
LSWGAWNLTTLSRTVGDASSVTGCYLIVYLCRNTRLMFASPLHYYSYLEMQLVLLSMGYFIYDAIDMLINDILNASYLVLMFHHISALYFLSFVPITHKFLLYSYWALLMEVSSIFLHCRSLLNQSKLSTSSMVSLYSLISYVNIVVFVIFRFLIQLFPFVWVLVNMHNMFFFLMCLLSDLCFFTTNCALFFRLLHSDGFLCWKVPNERLGVFIEKVEYADFEKDELLEGSRCTS